MPTEADLARVPNDCFAAPVGGRLAHFADHWDRLYNDPRLSRTVGQGILLHFKDSPPPLVRTPLSFPCSQRELARLREVVSQLLSKNAIEVVQQPYSLGFYSRLFTVPKESGGWRPVIDLSALNKFVDCPHFQMETGESIRRAIQPGEWVSSIDISDAYYHIPVAPAARKYFRFVIDEQVYQFRSLPFGLNTAPREFTKVLQPLLRQLRDLGIKVHAYLDDWAIRAPTEELCREHTRMVLRTLQFLGWRINESKSELTPRQCFNFLGMRFDTLAGTVAPAPKHADRIRSLYQLACRRRVWTARQMYSLVGYLQFLAPLTFRGRMHLRPIQRWFRERWVQSTGLWTDTVTMDPQLLALLHWWTLPDRFTGVPLLAAEPTLTLCTDASTSGWGAHLEQEDVSGVWAQNVQEYHINTLELMAVQLAIHHFAHALRNRSVRLYCDNATAVTYLRKEGGTHSPTLSTLAEEILQRCDSLHLDLLPVHLPGMRNVRADALSRRGMVLPGEWSLHPNLLLPVFREWGTPLVDMFATSVNKQTPIFVAPYPDPAAWRVDALSFPWVDLGLVYAYPPPPILPLVLNHIRRAHNTQVILIAPDQPLRAWYPDLLALSRAGPRPLPLHQWPLRQRVPGTRGWTYHLRPEALNLAAWLLSGAV